MLIGLAFLFGLTGSIPGMFLGLLLTVLLGAACAAASNALALTTKSEDVMAPLINSIALPVLLLSGILLPMTIGPQWLQIVSDFIPTKYIVNAIRELFTGDFFTITVFWGVLWTLVLFAAGLWVGTRTFRKENA